MSDANVINIDDKIISSCRICGSIMLNSSRDICYKCAKKEDFIFLKAKNFLRSNPGATVEQICNQVNTTPETIKRFIVSGKFARAGIRKVAHECLLCKRTIYEGIMCEHCESVLREQLDTLMKN